MKKIISIVMAVVMMMTVMSTAVSVSAASASTAIPGTNISYTLQNGTLTVNGEGEIPNYTNTQNAPWGSYNIKNTISRIIIGSGITAIGNYAFSNLDNLTTVMLFAEGRLKRIGDYAFFYDCSLMSIDIPKSVQTVGEHSFYHCEKLSDIKTDASASFATYAFAHCDMIGSVNAPNAKYFGKYCFTDSSNLSTFNAPKATLGERVFGFDSNVKNVTCGSLENYALSNAKKITKLGLKNAKFIGQYALYGCTGLKRISSDATSVGNFAFEDCILLKTVSLPKATTIGISAFAYLPELTNVALGKVKNIKEHAFNRCYKLKKVSGCNNIVTVGASAFYGCEKMTGSFGAKNIISVGSCAFYGCKSLKSTFSFKKVKKIESYAFLACSNIKTNTLGSKLKSLGSDAFSGCSKITSIYVPSTCKDVGYTPFSTVKNFKRTSSSYFEYKYDSANPKIKVVCDKNSAMYKFVKARSWYKYKLGIAVKSVKLNATKLTLKKGRTFKLKAYLSPKNASNKSILLKTSNKKVATIASNGVIKGIKKGKCKITVTAKDGSRKSKSVAVTVK